MERLLDLFSSNFLDDGLNLSAFLTDITTTKPLISRNLSNVVVDSVDVVAGTARVAYGSWQVKRNGSGVWQLAGNQRLALVEIRTAAQQNICTVGSAICQPSGTTRFTGLELLIINQGLLPLGSALVTGPGLPTSGVTLTASSNSAFFSISAPPPSCQVCSPDVFTMTDAEITGLFPNSSYTVQLFSNDPTPQLMAT